MEKIEKKEGQNVDRSMFTQEELNDIAISMFGLEDWLKKDVRFDRIVLDRPDKSRDIRELLSYSVGCMFGRYSLDREKVVYAGGEWDEDEYVSFVPDKDNIIPITDEYYQDDIVGMFCAWLKKVY